MSVGARPNRVLHVMRMRGISGAENHLLALAAVLREHGWLSDVVIPSPVPAAVEEFAKRLAASCERVEVVPVKGDLNPKLILRLARLLASGRYDVAHAHLVHADWYLAAASLISGGVPLVSSKHNPDPFRRLGAFRLLERAALRRYAAVISISDSLSNFTEVPSGVHTATVPYGLPAPADPPRREETGSSPTLLAVGRLERQKGFDVAIEAMARVAREAPSALLSIAGEGTQRRLLAERIHALRITEAVSLLGNRDDVDELMAGADILVHPARWEGFGLVLLEAMRARLPIVATQAGAIPEVVADGVTGHLVPPDDPDQLAKAILDLIRDPMRRREMGTAGFTRLKELFTPEQMGRSVAAVYDAVLERHAPMAATTGAR